jgi:CheY-specific phosphatase CheX
MTDSRFTTQQWRDAVRGAASEISRYALGFDGATVAEPAPEPAAATASMIGAHIPLVGSQSFEISLVATRESCQALAGAVLGMGTEAELAAAIVADAIGEIANQLAGGVKRRLASNGGDLELGLPVFVNGSVEPTGRQSVTALPTKFGAIAAMVVIVGPK